MSHGDLNKFFRPKDGEKISIRILDEPPLSMNQHFIEPRKGWYWDNGILMHDIGDEPKLCTLGGPYDENIQPVRRHHLPVMHDGELKILALNSALMKKITETARRIQAELQAKMLVESQRAAAARFKRSKMFYGAKR